MEKRSRRFGTGYTRNDRHLTPEDFPDQERELREYRADLLNEQQAFNAQWYSEDHDDVRRDQRRYFFRRLEELQPACVSSLYELMPAFKQIFTEHPKPNASRKFYAQGLLESFRSEYLNVDAAQRAHLDEIIEKKLTAIATGHQVRQSAPYVGDEDIPGIEVVYSDKVLFETEKKALKRVLQIDIQHNQDDVDDRFMVIFRPLYRWLTRWNLLEPWVADVAITTLLDWEEQGVSKPYANEFATHVRPKSIPHNIKPFYDPLEPEPEDLHFKFVYEADWDIEAERFGEFQERGLQAMKEQFKALKKPIDNYMSHYGYDEATGRVNMYDIKPFSWLIQNKVEGVPFEEIAEKELQRLEREANAKSKKKKKVAVESKEDEEDRRLEKLLKLEKSIEKATQRLASRIKLTL